MDPPASRYYLRSSQRSLTSQPSFANPPGFLPFKGWNSMSSPPKNATTLSTNVEL